MVISGNSTDDEDDIFDIEEGNEALLDDLDENRNDSIFEDTENNDQGKVLFPFFLRGVFFLQREFNLTNLLLP